MKEVVYFMVFFSLLSLGSALVANKTEFDDGASAFNITSNTTKYITLPINTTIDYANITIKGISVDSASINVSNAYCSATTVWGTDWMAQAFVVDEQTISKVSIYSDYNSNTRNDTITVSIRSTITDPDLTSVSYGARDGSADGYEFSPNARWHVFDFPDVNITGTNYIVMSCPTCPNDTIPFAPYLICENVYSGTSSIQNSDDSGVTWTPWGGGGANYDIRFIVYEPILPSYPELMLNGTGFFNATGNYSGTNYSSFKEVLESCNDYQAICPLSISAAAWGKIEITGLFIEYNKSYVAVPVINSPSQISTSKIIGESYSFELNVSNIGNWNATNISMETVSAGGTPNLNSSLSHDCGNVTLLTDSSVICNVTFSSLAQSAEFDERLKIGAIGSDSNDLVYSNSIDVDITVTAPVTPTAGGGGGSSYTRCNWKVFDPANRVISSYGWPGYSTSGISLIVYNNETQLINFAFSANGVPCKFLYDKMTVQGSSYGYNIVVCDYPEDVDRGKIIIQGAGCDTSVDVVLVSNEFGLAGLYLFGGAGLGTALGLWFGIFVVVAFVIYIWRRK